MLEEMASYLKTYSGIKTKHLSGDRVHAIWNQIKWTDVEESLLAKSCQECIMTRNDIMQITKWKHIASCIKMLASMHIDKAAGLLCPYY